MPRNVTKTYSQEVSVGRTCSECAHNWVYSETLKVSETKAGDFWEPSFDEEGMKEKLNKSIEAFKKNCSSRCYCPKCKALAVQTMNKYLPSGFLAAFKQGYVLSKKETKNVFIWGTIIILAIVLAFASGLDLSGVIDSLDIDGDSFPAVVGIIIATLVFGLFIIWILVVYVQNTIDFFKLNSVRESDLEIFDEKEAKQFFRDCRCEPFDLGAVGTMIPGYLDKHKMKHAGAEAS